MGRISACNILRQDSETSDYWRFGMAGKNPRRSAQVSGDPSEHLPSGHFVKGWNALWSSIINIGWLPMDRVFMRVVRIPKCETVEEMRSMVEFQLEKLSPIAVAQCVWSIEPVPNKSADPDQMQSVVLLLASRHLVEDCLEKLEARQFEADRLEVPFVHQLLSACDGSNGVWFFPFTSGGRHCCLLAWWEHLTLQNISVINLGAEDGWEKELSSELTRIRWSGEVEGWAGQGMPRLNLVADEKEAVTWEPMLERIQEGPIKVMPRMTREKLAEENVRRLARNESHANLIPEERAVRYRQRLTDRLWMRGIGAVILCYMLLVGVYFGWLETLKMEKRELLAQVILLEPDFKEAQALDARLGVQKLQIGLRYAALDGWLAVSETIPDGLVLNSFRFVDGSEFSLSGTAPLDEIEKVTDFNQILSEYEVEGKQIFRKVTPPTFRQINNQTASIMDWSFTAELGDLGKE